MAHITLRPTGPGATQFIINGIDFSRETFRGVELVEVGDDPAWSEVGLRVTFAVSRLDLGDEQDIVITDDLPAVAQRVHSMVEEVAP